MKRNDQESPHQKIITASTENEKTPRSSDKKVKENNSPLCTAIVDNSVNLTAEICNNNGSILK
jgi:alpha-galactosidase/6-phospho-beta-glucosidase family protein